jgi:Xaa-Pro aminopeptidase
MRATVDLVREMGLVRGRIGIEGSFISAWADHRLSDELPEATFVDAQGLLEELRAIKSPRELDLLRRGTRLAEDAIQGIASWLKSGTTAGEIGQFYRSHVLANADGGDVTSARITLRTGRDVLSPRSASTHVTEPGDVIFLDCGVEVGGYWADIGRTAVLGAPSPAQRQLYGILRDGFAEATALIEPGRPVADLFTTGLSAVRRHLPQYTRGNLGHGVGLHPAPELPIVSAEEPRWLTPGHVLSVEFPYYIGGIGAFTVEDTFAIGIGEQSVEVLNHLSHDLIEIDA